MSSVWSENYKEEEGPVRVTTQTSLSFYCKRCKSLPTAPSLNNLFDRTGHHDFRQHLLRNAANHHKHQTQ